MSNDPNKPKGPACPSCGETDIDQLCWVDDSDLVRCASCGRVFDPGVSQDPTCEASAPTPEGATGLCGKPATWLARGGYLVRPIALCQGCKDEIEKSTRHWWEQPTFERL